MLLVIMVVVDEGVERAFELARLVGVAGREVHNGNTDESG